MQQPDINKNTRVWVSDLRAKDVTGKGKGYWIDISRTLEGFASDYKEVDLADFNGEAYAEK